MTIHLLHVLACYSGGMATLRATVVLEKSSGKPEDAVRNVFHFNTAGAIDATDMTTVGDALYAFYNAQGVILANSIKRAANANRIEFAEVTRGGPGAADDQVSTLLATRSMGAILGAALAFDYPNEVAICVSLNAAVEGVPEEANGGLQRPRSRRRGRFYLGPLARHVGNQEAGTNRVIVAPEVRDSIVADFNNLLIGGLDGPGRIVNLGIYSRTDGLVRKVEGIFVDDAFDTVRSRGETAIARTEAAVVQPALVP